MCTWNSQGFFFKRFKIDYILLFVFLVFLLKSCITTSIDRTPYQQTSYYQQMDRRLANLNLDSLQTAGDTLKAGWAKVNITPSEPVPLAGYGYRKGKKFTSINDSIWVRAFVFDNGKQKAAMVAMDLLIVPPEVVKELTRELPKIGFSIDQTYLSATHTHNSIGGWAKKIVGMIIAGVYSEDVVHELTAHVITAIERADKNKEKAEFGYAQFNAAELVNNRITADGYTDPWLRVFKIKQASGHTALITSFAAHATCLPMDSYMLSRDYPGALVDTLEKDPDIDFAAFSAGGVGSHAPGGEGDPYQRIAYLAKTLSQKIVTGFDTIPLSYEHKLFTVKLPLPLREPHWRIGSNTSLRPWLFYSLYGDYPASVTALKVGNVNWVGTPCDFSGEITPLVQSKLKHPETPLFITSFNGGYIGYVTHDKHFDVEHYETRSMSWFGPENGAYFAEVISRLVDKL